MFYEMLSKKVSKEGTKFRPRFWLNNPENDLTTFFDANAIDPVWEREIHARMVHNFLPNFHAVNRKVKRIYGRKRGLILKYRNLRYKN